MPPRRISFLPASCERFLIWSEASYEAGTGELGFVLFDPELDGSGFLYSEGLMPQDLHDLLVPKQQQIVQREIIAAIAPYLSLPDLLRDRDVIHWIDNISAISYASSMALSPSRTRPALLMPSTSSMCICALRVCRVACQHC